MERVKVKLEKEEGTTSRGYGDLLVAVMGQNESRRVRRIVEEVSEEGWNVTHTHAPVPHLTPPSPPPLSLRSEIETVD